MEFITTPDETGKGRIKVDGRFYGLPLDTVIRIKEMQDALVTSPHVKINAGEVKE